MYNYTYDETGPKNTSSDCCDVLDKKTKKLYLLIGTIAFVVILIFVFTFSSKSVRLKYDWGTSFDRIMSKEGDDVYRFDQDRYEFDHIKSYDKKHKIDRLKEFDISSEGVSYVLREGKLLRLGYYFVNDFSEEEVVAIASSYYGNNYYERGSEYIWWKNGTVVSVDTYDSRISYYDEVDFLEAEDSYYERYSSEDILDFFGKKRYDDGK